MTQTFKLYPFQDHSFQSENWSDFNVIVQIHRTPNLLKLSYQLEGELSDLVFPEKKETPHRQNNLWETTCLEFFFGLKNSVDYYEINLSTNGNWNIYHFENYREGMTEASEVKALKPQTTISESQVRLDCQFPLNPLELASTPLELSTTAVIEKKSGAISYWATKHTATEADFHQRNSFIIQV